MFGQVGYLIGHCYSFGQVAKPRQIWSYWGEPLCCFWGNLSN